MFGFEIKDEQLKSPVRLEDHFMSVLQAFADSRQYQTELEVVRKVLAENLDPKMSSDVMWGREHGESPAEAYNPS